MSQTWVVLLHGDEKAWETADEATRAAAYADHDAFSAACAERGHTIVGGHELASSSRAVVVRNDADGPAVTDGPYAELKETLVSFSIVDVASHDRAVEIAARVVEVTGEPIEVRPIMDGPSPDG